MTGEVTGGAPAGLRERKKQRTRQEISDVATRLFNEEGFERVTLSRIADAAEVFVKTIFNHFGSKEDIYFDRADELRAGFDRTIAERPAGVTVLGALRALLVDNLVPFPGRGWGGLDDHLQADLFRRFLQTQDRSPALRARRLTLGAELGEHLADVLAGELGGPADAPPVRTLAAMVIAAFHLRDETLRAAVAAERGPQAVQAEVTRTVEDAFARLEAAFGDLDRAR